MPADADIRDHRRRGTARSARCTSRARAVGRRRVRHCSYIHERGCFQGEPRLLLVLPIRHTDRWAAPGVTRARGPTESPDYRRAQGLGLAYSLCDRRACGDRRDVPETIALGNASEESMHNKEAGSVTGLIRHHPRAILIVLAFTMGGSPLF